jgi:hypothetical protein
MSLVTWAAEPGASQQAVVEAAMIVLRRKRSQFFIDVGGSCSTADIRSTVIGFRRVSVIVQLIESLHHLVS